MCKGAVAAPRPLQALVYPILRRMSLPFCEKIVDFQKSSQISVQRQSTDAAGAGPGRRKTTDDAEMVDYSRFFCALACTLPCST